MVMPRPHRNQSAASAVVWCSRRQRTPPTRPDDHQRDEAHVASTAVGITTVSFNGYTDYIPLADGIWAGEDGASVELQDPCGIGELDGTAPRTRSAR
jgi:hypothetical protein